MTLSNYVQLKKYEVYLVRMSVQKKLGELRSSLYLQSSLHESFASDLKQAFIIDYLL